jgi:hypothetical protein
MDISVRVERTIRAAPPAVFALALDATRFPATFAGCGPIPALRRITPLAAPAVGSEREVESSDGSLLIEQITAFDPPRRHAYTLSGLRPPLAWLVRSGCADWHFSAVGDNETCISWNYTFALTHALVWPIAAPLLRIFMGGAMRRCLGAMAHELQVQAV